MSRELKDRKDLLGATQGRASPLGKGSEQQAQMPPKQATLVPEVWLDPGWRGEGG